MVNGYRDPKNQELLKVKFSSFLTFEFHFNLYEKECRIFLCKNSYKIVKSSIYDSGSNNCAVKTDSL